MLQETLTIVGLALLVFGISTPFWTAVGLGRLLRRALRRETPTALIGRDRVAVLIAAHNEVAVLPTTLRSALGQVPADQVFVVSDGSTDGTGEIARARGVNVLDLFPNRGKAGALAAAIEHFALADRFEVVTLLDADTVLAPDYLTTGLPLFDAPDVVAVAGTAATSRLPGPRTTLGRVLVAYRERVYVVVQYLQKFGQAARAANVVAIVPGFASMYRARVLADIEITAPGLVIEDFNMTFEVHAKRLGRIAFRPGAALAYTQDPDTLRDYAKQVGRWSLGFWQTMLRHDWRFGRFWVAVTVSAAELIVSSAVFVLLIPAVTISTVAGAAAATGIDDSGVGWTVAAVLPVPVLLAGALLPDYLLTVIAAIVARRPWFLLLGLVFPLVRLVDAAMSLRRIGTALAATSNGVWASPARRPTEDVAAELVPVPGRTLAQ